MDNADYQQLINERSRLRDEERRRQFAEDMARQQEQQRRKQQEEQQRIARKRREDERIRARSFEGGKLNQPPIGPVDYWSYQKGKSIYDEEQRKERAAAARRQAEATEAQARQARARQGMGGPVQVSRGIAYPGAFAGSRKKSHGGLVFLAILAFLVWIVVRSTGGKPAASSPSTIATQTASAPSSASAPTVVPSPSPQTPFAGQPAPPAASTGSNDSATATAPSSAFSPPAVTPAPSEAAPTEAALAAPLRQFSDVILGVVPSPASAASLPADSLLYSATHKGGEGCNGTLLLSHAGLAFACPTNPGRNFSISLAQIKKVDDDGVELFSKDAYGRNKYHFKMGDHADKDAVHALFENWLNFSRGTPAADGQ